MRILDTTRINGHAFFFDRYVAFVSIPAALVVYFCVEHLDRAVSLLVKSCMYGNDTWSGLTSSLPDLLLITVLFTTAATYILFRYRVSRGIIDLTTLTCKMLAIAAPLSFIVKSALKFCFGRINTREWLLAPGQYDFHWFQGGGAYSGFPSGHMAVFTALSAVMWRLHPRYRRLYLAFLLLLALALILTNYHFVSDVIAGAYLGLLVELCIWRALAEDVTRRLCGNCPK